MAGIMDSLLGWILYLDPALGIMVISFILSLIISLAIKFLTDQSLMKDLKDELKELQKEMRDLRNNPKKMSKINSRFMETNMKYMNHSMKPTLYTFIPLLFAFAWMNSNLGYYPLMPNEPFQVIAMFDKSPETFNLSLSVPEGLSVIEGPNFLEGNKRAWVLKGSEGEYNITLSSNGHEYVKTLLITTERKYSTVEQDYRKRALFFSSSSEGNLDKITLGNTKVLPFSNTPVLKEIPWVSGWSWFGAYIVFSLIFSISLRKLLNLY